MIGTSQLINTFSRPCFTDTTDIFKDGSGVALYGLDYDASDAGGASGKFGEAAIFNGSSSYIAIGSPIPNTDTNVAISAWVKLSSGISSNMHITGTGITSAGSEAPFRATLQYQSANTFRIFALRQVAGTYYLAANSTLTDVTINADTWYHVVWSYNSTGRKLSTFLNGTAIDTDVSMSTSGSSVNDSSTVIGSFRSTSGPFFDGSIDQVRIYNTALTSSQVTQLYQENNSTVGTHLFGCIANYNLDGSAKESMGTTAHDGTETDITYRYDGTPTAVDFGVGGKSNYGTRFNGSSSYINLGTGSSGLSGLLNQKVSQSVSFWMNTSYTGISGNSIIYSVYAGGGISLNIYYLTNGTLYFLTRYTNSDTTFTTTQTFNDSQWHHISVTIDVPNLERKIYIDNSLVSTQALSSNAYGGSGTTGVALGTNGNFNTQYYKGDLDQVRIFNKAISSAEVSKLYGNGAGEIACEYTATTTNVNYPVTNTAYYKLDNSAIDETGSYNGTETNVEYRFGRFGQAAVFNGSSSKITASSFASLSQVGISMWVNIADVTSSYALIARYGTNREFSIYNYQSSNGFIAALYYNGNNSNSVQITASDYLTNNTWHHIAYSANGSTEPKLYIDGVQVGSAQYTDSTRCAYYTSTEDLCLGGNAGLNRYLNGKIDQVRIYSTALSASQVTKLYNEKPETDTSTFKTVLYTGDGGTQYISNVGFEPDLVWLKSRSYANNHFLYDSVRGANKAIYIQAEAEITRSGVTSFDSNGFTLGTSGDMNTSSATYVAWVWKGGGDAVSNTDGSITSQVSANQDAGFSIVKYTGASGSVGHGLSSTPEIIIQKQTDGTLPWYTYVAPGVIDSTSNYYYLELNTTAAKGTTGATPPTSTTFNPVSTSGNFVAYCFHSVSGYSKIGSYSGSTTTVTVNIGFKPSFVMIKRTNQTRDWILFDTVRSGGTSMDDYLTPNSSLAEIANSSIVVNATSTGFTIASGLWAGVNENGGEYLYMAFK